MKKNIFLILAIITANLSFGQTASIRVALASYSSTDPDGAGPATGSVTFNYEVMASTPLLADAIGFIMPFQSSKLMATPTPMITKLNQFAPLPLWNLSADNREGNTINRTYGGQTFDKRMVVVFNQGNGVPTLPVTTTWTAVLAITYWTLGSASPEGGYVTMEPGSIVPASELSTEGGDNPIGFLSPNLNTPLLVGGALPVLFSSFDAKCSGTGTLVSWATAQESNSDYFEVQRSTDGNSWKTIGRTPAAGFSGGARNYNQLDLEAGNALYRIKQVDKDGAAVYTGIERANCQVKTISSVIYPVPAKDVLNVVIKSDKAIRTQLMVFEMSGKMVRKLDASVQNGTNNFRIDIKGLTSGDYIIKSSDAGIELNKKFTIVN